jgi:(S)-ureidoglycine aminohydrolase
MELFGTTRTRVAARHALIAEDGYVPSVFPGWKAATAFVHLSPAMGSRVTQMTVVFDEDGGTAMFPNSDHEHVFYIESGSASWNGKNAPAGDYAFVPAGTKIILSGEKGTRVTVFRKEYQPLSRLKKPEVIAGAARDVPGEPFLGNKHALLQTLLPTDDRFDLAVNIFTYQPGATLPFVETHIMEHGLKMLSGQGVYRLEEEYYPVKKGDVIWMAAYCPQWFVAMGDEPASYIYYKDVNRLP